MFDSAIINWCLINTFANEGFLCFAAVKFGRMSKKQREKVEDEVRYHRAAQQRAQQVEIPDTTISSYNEGHQTPSSTDPHIFPAGYVSALSPTNYPFSAHMLKPTFCHISSETNIIYHMYRDDRVILFSSRGKKNIIYPKRQANNLITHL